MSNLDQHPFRIDDTVVMVKTTQLHDPERGDEFVGRPVDFIASLTEAATGTVESVGWSGREFWMEVTMDQDNATYVANDVNAFNLRKPRDTDATPSRRAKFAAMVGV